MDDLDIDETLPGQEIEEESLENVVRRESNSSSLSELSSTDNGNGDSQDEDSQRGMLYFKIMTIQLTNMRFITLNGP